MRPAPYYLNKGIYIYIIRRQKSVKFNPKHKMQSLDHNVAKSLLMCCFLTDLSLIISAIYLFVAAIQTASTKESY